MALLNPGGAIAQFQRNDCSISPVEVIWRGGVRIYDAASWMAVTCLSEQSIAMGSAPVPFPDFTDGRWLAREARPGDMYSLDAVYEEAFED